MYLIGDWMISSIEKGARSIPDFMCDSSGWIIDCYQVNADKIFGIFSSKAPPFLYQPSQAHCGVYAPKMSKLTAHGQHDDTSTLHENPSGLDASS